MVIMDAVFTSGERQENREAPKTPHGLPHMASITQYKDGWRAQVKVLGVRASETFRTKREAVAWASALETQIREDAGKTPGERHTLADALTRYRDEVSVHKRGKRWEEIRIAAFLKSSLPLKKPLAGISPEDIAIWRDERLRSVGNGTVLREISLLSAVLEHARREWRWIPVNPVADVRKPRQPDHRERIITRQEVKGMLKAFGYSPRLPVKSVNQACGVAMLLAIRTGMRAGEICRLEWSRVHDGYCRLPVTKTTPRDVPLTPKAMRLVGKMRGFDPLRVFGIAPQTLDTLFRRARDRAGLSGFVFHDTRRTAATNLSKKVDVLMLCRIFGWKNPAMAMVYYAPSHKDMVERLT